MITARFRYGPGSYQGEKFSRFAPEIPPAGGGGNQGSRPIPCDRAHVWNSRKPSLRRSLPPCRVSPVCVHQGLSRCCLFFFLCNADQSHTKSPQVPTGPHRSPQPSAEATQCREPQRAFAAHTTCLTNSTRSFGAWQPCRVAPSALRRWHLHAFVTSGAPFARLR